MLFRQHTLEAIDRGAVTLAFRRWRRPSVKAGGRLRTAAGELAIETVEIVDVESITDADAARAGFATRENLIADLNAQREGQVYRVEFRLAGPDTRIALREQADLSAEDIATIARKLGKFDAATQGPWTRLVLRLIADRPEVRAAVLAHAGGFEKDWLKIHIRKLKDLGLTESLEVGYRLSPRGRAFLDGIS